MIYLVSKNQSLFKSEKYKIMSLQDSIETLESWDIIQCDSETSGRDPNICDLLCVQFGNKESTTQIVVDCTTIDIKEYKKILENKKIIGHNLKFDLQFLYNYGIIPRNVYDTMIIEQLIYLGYPSGKISYSLKSVAERRLGIDIDKTVRGEIIWRGLDEQVILYAAGDVMYLCNILKSQIQDLKDQNLTKAAKLECDFIPSIAYLEWCGIYLDIDKWMTKMKSDKENLNKATKDLNGFVISNPKYNKYTYIDRQGSLFDGFDLEPKCLINWDSPIQVVEFAKELGFDTQVKDKGTGEDKDSVLEKHLKTQKGINDEFLKLYIDYKKYSKVVSSFGQGHLNAVNPNTGRIHTTFRQFGTLSGRLSSGSNQPNYDLAKCKKIPPSDCKYPNLQQLPKDAETRSCFAAPPGYKFVSADFSAEESRLGADIYQDQNFLKEFTEGSGDTHSMFAWAVFRKECEACGCKDVSEVASKAKQWRQKVKAVEFAYMFGAAAPTISQAANCTVEEAQAYINTLDKEFTGMAEFAKRGSQFVRENGYIIICPYTGHRLHWWDHDAWLQRQFSFTKTFWENYKLYHKGTGDDVAKMVRQHFQAAGKYDRMARNVVTQGEFVP